MTAPIKEPVRIRRKNLANGNVSLYLAIYIDGHREYEFLKLYLIPEKTRADREANRNTLALANSIKAQRIVEVQNGAHGFKSDYREQTLFYDYYNALTEKRKKKESRGNYSNWASCLRHLQKYDPRLGLNFRISLPNGWRAFAAISRTRRRRLAVTTGSARRGVTCRRTRGSRISTSCAHV